MALIRLLCKSYLENVKVTSPNILHEMIMDTNIEDKLYMVYFILYIYI